MPGLGTIINVIAIICGGIVGVFFKRFIKERYQDAIMKTSGISVIFLGLAGSLSGLLRVNADTESVETQKVMMMILALVAAHVRMCRDSVWKR